MGQFRKWNPLLEIEGSWHPDTLGDYANVKDRIVRFGFVVWNGCIYSSERRRLMDRRRRQQERRRVRRELTEQQGVEMHLAEMGIRVSR